MGAKPSVLRIERACDDDVHAIHDVLRETWIDTYRPHLSPAALEQVTTTWHDPALIAKRVHDPEIWFAVARDDSDVIGGLVMAQEKVMGELFIYRLYVRPGRQHEGIGTALFDETLNVYPGIRRVRLQVVAHNEKGFSFWHKLGFTECGTKHETVAGESILVTEMVKTVS